MMRHGLLLIVALGAAPPVWAQIKGDKAHLQGVWKVVRAEHGATVRVDGDVYVLVDGNRSSWQTSNSTLEGGLYLFSSRNPKAFDFATSARTIEGIYSLEGDELRLCYQFGTDARRPGKLAASSGQHQVLLILRRVKGMDIRNFKLPDGSKAFPTLVSPTAPPAPPAQTVPHAPQRQPVSPKRLGGKIAPEPARVGQIFVVGNGKTPMDVILRELDLYPGQVLSYSSLRSAEKKLAALKRFVVDPEAGIRPTVTVLAPGGSFCDVLVTVKER